MSASLAKAITCLQEIHDQEQILHRMLRVELKRVKSGHWRLYLAAMAGVPDELAMSVRALLHDRGVSVNPFGRAGMLSSITIVDDDELEG